MDANSVRSEERLISQKTQTACQLVSDVSMQDEGASNTFETLVELLQLRAAVAHRLHSHRSICYLGIAKVRKS